MSQIKLTDTSIKHVEDDSNQLDTIINDIINPYCKDLDEYVEFVDSLLRDSANPPTDVELDDFCMNLSTRIYFTSSKCEMLGIRDDIAKAIYKEMYHTNRNNCLEGTVQDKNSIAELASQEEQLVSMCYSRAYHIVKAKVDAAQELLGSVKKVISRRIKNLEMSNIGGNL